jgi:hypothetical protein
MKTIILILACFLFGCQNCPLKPVSPGGNAPGISSPTQQVVQKAMNLPWLLSISVFGIAGGIVGVLFLPGPLKTLALALTAFCALSLGLTLLVVQYAVWLVIGTVTACIGIGVYGILRQKNMRTVTEQAIKDLVKTVDLTKTKLTAEAKEHLFGTQQPAKNVGAIHAVQAATTEALVAEVRKQI